MIQGKYFKANKEMNKKLKKKYCKLLYNFSKLTHSLIKKYND